MSTATPAATIEAPRGLPSAWTRLRQGLDRASLYLPIILTGALALGTYWLVRNTPIFGPPKPALPVLHKPD